MKKIKLPGIISLILGSFGAFWIAGFVNPGFNPVGVMMLMLIPVVSVVFLYPEPGLEELLGELNINSYGKTESAADELVEQETASKEAS